MDWRTQHCKDVNSPLKANNKQTNKEKRNKRNPNWKGKSKTVTADDIL